ncbi:hypothetical protein WJ22_07545 [Burkholderia vietnamiensis]|nr:hypothetical protein WJ19_18830 [Burkholderia vietnamiensis]KVF92650.1 hypothetical protein WJ20_08095 [Burkholderia vietnamiensis]KVG03490.1 hypothetical protein WJ22_07545 [Burkholderia vietnamiensis]
MLSGKRKKMTIQNHLLAILPYVDDPEDKQRAAAIGLPFGDIYAQICARLNENPPQRSVRRAMSEMPDYVDHVGHTRGARWFKVRDTGMLRSEERMQTNTAIALRALRRVATYQLPDVVFAELEQKFAQAQATLDLGRDDRARQGKSWEAKFMKIDGTQPLVFPSIDPAIYRSITDALLRDRRLDIRYEPNKPVPEIAEYRKLSPLGLLDLTGLLYLIVHAPDKTRMLRVDRMRAATVREQAAQAIPGFNLEAYVRQSHLAEYMPEPEVELKLRIHPREGKYARTAAQHILTSIKLDANQQIRWDGGRRTFVLTARVRPSVSLRNFLHSQSDTIEVLAPASMRAEFAKRLRRMADRYASGCSD